MKVLVGDRLSYGKSLARFRLPGERALIAAIAIAFLVLHILAGTILQRAAVGKPAAQREETRSSLYDLRRRLRCFASGSAGSLSKQTRQA